MPKKVMVSWSSGKDSALCLQRLIEAPDFDVVGLFTTYDEQTERLPIQGVPLDCVKAQAEQAGLPLVSIPLPPRCPNSIYESLVVDGLKKSSRDFGCLAFGDLFLDGIRAYREKFLSPAGYELTFPMMGENTGKLAREIIDRGIKAVVCSVDRTQLGQEFCGKLYDDAFLHSLPPDVDPCGEKGEFHSFVFQAPFFVAPPGIRFGEIYPDDRWTYLKLETATASPERSNPAELFSRSRVQSAGSS